jgi:hypothetical protein
MRTGGNQPKYLTESQLGQTAGPNVDMAGRFSVQGHRRYCLGIPTTTNKLLMHKDAHSGHSSEGALILQANWSDFDSAIPWFESRRPSHPVHSPESPRYDVAERAAVGGLLASGGESPYPEFDRFSA